MPRARCPKGHVNIDGNCLPEKKLNALYDEFTVEMSVDPFESERTPRQNIETFMRNKHPQMRPRRIWVDGLYRIYRKEAK